MNKKMRLGLILMLVSIPTGTYGMLEIDPIYLVSGLLFGVGAYLLYKGGGNR